MVTRSQTHFHLEPTNNVDGQKISFFTNTISVNLYMKPVLLQQLFWWATTLEPLAHQDNCWIFAMIMELVQSW